MTDPVTIQTMKNGPLVVKGEIKLLDAEGKDIPAVKMAFCRCGHSANKPFCDGSHRTSNFVA